MNTRFETYLGNVRSLPFRLRRAGERADWDVSTATSIVLEVEDTDENNLTPIAADPLNPAADWEAGQVVVVVDATNVTAAVGTYKAILTVFIGGEIISTNPVTIEVQPRPGFSIP
jgi:hypothetical protein